jgi:transcriptional regulator with XRE-family HTH domain/tetratricopeptide (TPR) repeat protein
LTNRGISVGDQLADVLRRLRSQAGLTQEDLSERSGVSARTIRGIETGKRRNPQLASVRRLAEALGLPAEQRQQLLSVAVTASTGTTSAPDRVGIAPRQLPAPPRYFVGRTAELSELTSALDDATDAGGTVLISALAGAGGIGKTALALRWAQTNLHRFPDGQLFVDLRGFSPAGPPVAPGTAVRGFLDAFGVDPGRIPADLDARAALYRSLVADKRMLIVLDNAADAAQVVPLLPGSPTCTVIVTSRQHLTSLITRHGAHHLKLRVLTEDDARHLLVARIGADRAMAESAAAEELLACCGGFALALDIVAARAKMNGHTTLAEAAAELRDDTTRLGALDDEDPAASLPAVLSWSYRALTTEQRTVFGLLGVAPGPDIALPAAASLTGLTLPRARVVLRALEAASLLDEHPAGRYTMHDLIRAYATGTAHRDLAEDTRQAALRRVLDFYAHTAHTAEQLLATRRRPIQLDPPAPGAHPQPLPDAAAALAWFDSEHPTLLAAARQTAVSHGWHPIVWQLAWTLDPYLYRRGHRHERLAVWQAAVAAAAHLPDPTRGVHAHRGAGNACAELGRHDEATRHLHQALALAEHHDDPAQQADTHHMLAWAWGLRDDRVRALEHATQALDLHRAFDHPAGKAAALNLVG